MTPDAWFVDEQGDPFPSLNPGVQYTEQYQWQVDHLAVRIHATGPYQVELDGTPPETLTLQDGLYRRLMPSRRAERRQRDEQAGGAGDLIAIVRDPDGLECTRIVLRILPANFSPEEMQRLLNDIGELALSQVSRVWAAGLGAESRAGKGSMTLRRLERCISAWESVWQGICRAPLQAHNRTLGSASTASLLRRPGGHARVLSRPGRQRHFGLQLAESPDCPENRWIIWALHQVLLPVIHALLGLSRENDRRASSQHDENQWFLERLDKAIQIGRLDAGDFRSQAEHAPRRSALPLRTEQIQDLSDRLDGLLAAPFLQGRPLPHTEPARTLRLMGHPLYGLLVRSLDVCFDDLTRPLCQAAVFLGKVRAGQIRPTWRCYEIWCLITLMDVFERQGNFSPASRNDLWIHRLLNHGSDGGLTLVLPHDRPLLLTRRKRACEDRIEIRYEPQVPGCRGADGMRVKDGIRQMSPDFLIRVERLVKGALDTDILDKQSYDIILDAKYRDYNSCPKMAADDAWIVGKAKYLEGLSGACHFPQGVAPSAVFILHSTPPQDLPWMYWGEVPFSQWLSQLPIKVPFDPLDLADGWQDHRLGLIRFRPGDHETVGLQMLALWFGHFLRPNRSEPRCPHCLKKLHISRDIRFDSSPGIKYREDELIRRTLEGSLSRRRPSLFCLCPDCGFRWVLNHCFHQRHPLMKMGAQTLHAPSHHNYQPYWMYVCPTCGSDPSPEELELIREEARQHRDSLDCGPYWEHDRSWLPPNGAL